MLYLARPVVDLFSRGITIWTRPGCVCLSGCSTYQSCLEGRRGTYGRTSVSSNKCRMSTKRLFNTKLGLRCQYTQSFESHSSCNECSVVASKDESSNFKPSDAGLQEHEAFHKKSKLLNKKNATHRTRQKHPTPGIEPTTVGADSEALPSEPSAWMHGEWRESQQGCLASFVHPAYAKNNGTLSYKQNKNTPRFIQ